MTQKPYGMMAHFKDPGALLEAAKKLKAAGYVKFETYSPFPIHGMDDAMGLGQSKLGWIVACGGAFGLLFAITLQTWVSVAAYKITVSGKPLFSFQAFVPVCFELMVLFSGFSAVFGMFILNKLPQFYHSVFNYKHFSSVSSHGFVVGIEADDLQFHTEQTAAFLAEIGGSQIELVQA
ncbi:MAG: DUF3341 domain-containing protein [Candidatus Margulisiibacteriota bacterium]